MNLFEKLKEVNPYMWLRMKFFEINQSININNCFNTLIIVIPSGCGGGGWDIREITGRKTYGEDDCIIVERYGDSKSIPLARDALFDFLFEQHIDKYIAKKKEICTTRDEMMINLTNFRDHYIPKFHRELKYREEKH